MTDTEFRGRTAVVTGASRGLGRAIALALAARGADLVLTARDAAALEAVAAEIAALGRRALVLPADLADAAAAEAMARAVAAGCGAADIIVTAAGLRDHADLPVAEMDPAYYDRITRGNILSTVLPIRALLPAMIARGTGGGRIVTISGVFGIRGRARHAAGVSSKWAIEGFMRGLAIELGPQDITVNSVCPGYVEGARAEESLARIAAARSVPPAEVRAGLAARTLLGRLSNETDIAEAVLFLASPRARNITGQDLVVDGGWSI